MSDVQVDEVEPKELDVEVDAGDGDDDGGDVEWAADELIPFGKYVLLDRLSSGATAAVYRAHARGEAGFERVLAIKRILPHMAGDPEFVKTFVREAKTTARLTHANICSTYELGKVGESIYMAVEYVAGKDLGRIQRQLRRNDQSMSPVLAAWVAGLFEQLPGGAGGLLVFVTAFAAQWAMGAIINLWPAGDGHYALAGYRAAFGMMLALQLAATAWYFLAGRDRDGDRPLAG